MIVHGRRHQPLVPLATRSTARSSARAALRLRGRQRRRLGALRRPGEGAPAHRLADARVRARLDAAAAPPVGDAVLVTSRPTSGATSALGADELASPLGTGVLDGQHIADCNALGARGSAGCRRTRRFDRNPLDLARRGRAAGVDPAAHVVERLQDRRAALRLRGPRRAGEPPAGADGLAREPARLLGQGPRVLPPAPARRRGRRRARTRSRRRSCARREVVWREEAPTGKLDLLTTIDFRMTGSALFSDVVLPAATWYEKYDLSSTDLHPFVHAFNQAVPPPWEAKTDWDIFGRIAERVLASWPRSTSAPAATSSPRRCCTTRPTSSPSRSARCATGSAASASRFPARRCRSCSPSSATTPPSTREVARARPAASRSSASPAKGVSLEADARRSRSCAPRTATCAAGRPTGARARARRHACEAILALSGITNGRLAVEGFRGAGAAHRRRARRPRRGARGRPHHVRRHAGAAAHGDHLARVVGDRESRDRRYSPFTINVERDVPWRTLTGRQHFYVDHAWMLEFGEGLPAYRPPLNVARRLRRRRASATARRKELTLRYLTPALEVVDPLRVPGQPAHADPVPRRPGRVDLPTRTRGSIEVADNDWVEAYNRNGVVAVPRGRLAPDPRGRRA